jgi:predicted kinase
MSNPRLYLFVGYPGAGKTTIAQYITEQVGCVHIWADQERQAMFKEPTHSWEESQRLYAKLNEKVAQLLADGQSVIFDTNFNFKKDRDHLREIAAKQGAEAVIIWVTTPRELAKKRATEESGGQGTRLFGDMTPETWDRIASHLEPPDKSEPVIKIDGTNVDTNQLDQLLNL